MCVLTIFYNKWSWVPKFGMNNHLYCSLKEQHFAMINKVEKKLSSTRIRV